MTTHDDEQREDYEADAKTPPHDLGAEAAVIVTMFVMPEKRAEALALLRADHFFGRIYRTSFEALAAMHASGEPIDVTTFSTHLRESGRLSELGGEGVAGLLAGAAAHGNLHAYCRAIRDAWRMRELVKECQRWTAEAYESRGVDGELERGAGYAPAQALLDRVVSKATELGSDAATFTAQTSKQVMADAFQHVEGQAARIANGNALAGVTTGLTALDRKTSGLHAPDLVIVAGAASMGKSALLSHVAVSAASSGTGVLFLSLEMPTRDMGLRAACAIAGVRFSELRAGAYLLPDRSRKLLEAFAFVAELPITWDGVTVNASAKVPDVLELMAKAERAVADSKCKRMPAIGLVVVDYLQKIRALPSKGRRPPREEVVAQNAAGMKSLATRLGVPVLCASSINREAAHEGRKPRMSDLRESGAIEFEADAVWMIHRDDYKFERGGHRGDHVFDRECEIIVDKCRNGETGSVLVGFDREFTRFRDLEGYQHDERPSESLSEWPQ